MTNRRLLRGFCHLSSDTRAGVSAVTECRYLHCEDVGCHRVVKEQHLVQGVAVGVRFSKSPQVAPGLKVRVNAESVSVGSRVISLEEDPALAIDRLV